MKSLILSILSIPNKLYNFAIFTFRNVSYQNFPEIFGRIVIKGRGKISIGEGVKINSDATTNPVGLTKRAMFYVSEGAEINIGSNVGISTSLLYAATGITIEDDVLIGGGCQILDNDFHSQKYEIRRIMGQYVDVIEEPILIKKGAFVGTASIILKGVTVGEKSIVAAGSVVVKSIPPNEIWGGNPAKFIKKIEEAKINKNEFANSQEK